MVLTTLCYLIEEIFSGQSPSHQEHEVLGVRNSDDWNSAPAACPAPGRACARRMMPDSDKAQLTRAQ